MLFILYHNIISAYQYISCNILIWQNTISIQLCLHECFAVRAHDQPGGEELAAQLGSPWVWGTAQQTGKDQIRKYCLKRRLISSWFEVNLYHQQKHARMSAICRLANCYTGNDSASTHCWDRREPLKQSKGRVDCKCCVPRVWPLCLWEVLYRRTAVAGVLAKWIPRAHANTLDPTRASEIRSIYNGCLVAFDASSHCL